MSRPHSWVERRWESIDGLDCAVVVSEMGYRCGYVRIPRNHVLYGLESCDSILGQRAPLEVVRNRWMPIWGHDKFSDSSRLDYFFEAHGGITHVGQLAAEGMEGGWWLGFDCAHAWDAKDRDLMTPEFREMDERHGFYEDGVVRSPVYVSEWVSKLAHQVFEVGENFSGPKERLRWLPRAIRGPRHRTMRQRVKLKPLPPKPKPEAPAQKQLPERTGG